MLNLIPSLSSNANQFVIVRVRHHIHVWKYAITVKRLMPVCGFRNPVSEMYLEIYPKLVWHALLIVNYHSTHKKFFLKINL